MKFIWTLILAVSCSSLIAASPADEKAFTDKYKAAFEAKDAKTLESFLFTVGSDPGALEFYKLMMNAEAGSKISKIELIDLTPDEVAKAEQSMNGPFGQMCLTVKPTKKLQITIEQSDANGSSNSTTTRFVAEEDGKLVIPVPGPCVK
jgi:hypothetical protein